MLINLNDTEAKFCLYAVQELSHKLQTKLEGKTNQVIDIKPADTVRLTKAGRPAKKPGRKPGKKIITQPEQQAA